MLKSRERARGLTVHDAAGYDKVLIGTSDSI